MRLYMHFGDTTLIIHVNDDNTTLTKLKEACCTYFVVLPSNQQA